MSPIDKGARKAQRRYMAEQKREVDRSKKQLRIELQNMKEQVIKMEKEQGDKVRKKSEFTSTNVGAKLTPNIVSTFTG